MVIGWSSSKIVSGSRVLPPRWPPQCNCVVIESSFDPGELLQAPGSLWFLDYIIKKDIGINSRLIFNRLSSNRIWTWKKIHLSCNWGYNQDLRYSAFFNFIGVLHLWKVCDDDHTLTLTWFIRNIFYWNLQFLNHDIIILKLRFSSLRHRWP
jgi:hypothetical protein